MNIKDYITRFKEILHFENTIFEDIDNDLLLLAITSSTAYLPRMNMERLQRKFASKNYERLEFLGDSVLQMIITRLVYEMGTLNPGVMSHMRSDMVKNMNLYRYLNAKRLCKSYLSRQYKPKQCADVFEAILGALFIHGYYFKLRGYAVLDTIEHWLRNNFQIDNDLNEWLGSNKIKSVPTNDDGYWSEWSPWSECSHDQQERHRTCDSPPPKEGGRPCYGDATETRKCRWTSRWGPWSKWSYCEEGSRFRSRECHSPRSDCDGPWFEIEDC